ncbi:hypothetical protein N8I77_011768 [Diaporthe amygdali]|uniref:C2H2-type domain-containing protein n=1 Tax=Phomopsis amygdali TaxID=1214568 RepID=A0AAD9VZ90_PHOAM|nr:hypothetical protein N8I77_011768 [Diaporthe amygdali]
MNALMSTPLGELRAIAHALCENDNIKKRIANDLQASRRSTSGGANLEASNHIALIQQATGQELYTIVIDLCKNEDTKKQVDNYSQVLRYVKPDEVAPEAADPLTPIKKATRKELQTVLIVLCEDENAKKRIVHILRVLRQSKSHGAGLMGTDQAALINSATEMELRAIGLAICDGDEDMRKRMLESLLVLVTLDKLQVSKAARTLFKCLRCKKSFYEDENKERSCRYHPGESTLIESREILGQAKCYDRTTRDA